MLSVFFQGKIKFSHCTWSIWLFWIFFFFDLVPPFYFLKWNLYFSACENLPNSPCHFESTNHFSFKFCINLQCYQTWLPCTFLAQKLYTLVKKSPLKWKFMTLSSTRGKICQICHVNIRKTCQFLSKFCIILHRIDI